MFKTKKNKLKTVSEKVAELIINPHGESDSDGSGSADDDAPRLVDFDEEEYQAPDQQATEIRKRNVKLLSEQSARYSGKIASRYESDSQDSEGEEDEISDEEEDMGDREEGENDGGIEENSEEEEEDGSIDDDDEDEDDDDSELENEEESAAAEAAIISETNRQAEVQKGVCVQNQLRVWEKLLEVRINAQKLLSKTNQLPAPADLQRQRAEQPDLQKATAETAAKTGKLLQTLLELQTTLCSQFSEMRGAMKNTLKRPAPFRSGSDCGPPPTKRIAEHLEAHSTELRSYRNAVLLKWDDRTRLLTPGAGAKKKTLSLQEEFDVVRKIENTLAQRSALLGKSQIVKSATPAKSSAGESVEEQQPNANVYDDSDFYHQQLRELIEYKANTSASMSEVTKQYVELQKLRQKMKKKVDTRASKGRKLRYIVHNKLINFMAPDDTSTWTPESRDELGKSLFAA